MIWSNVTVSLCLQQNCTESSLKELSKNQYLSVRLFFFLDIRTFLNASRIVIIDELHVVLAFSANPYLLKYLSDQYSSRCLSFKLLTTVETQIIEITLRKTVYNQRSRNYIDSNKQATESLNLEAFVGVSYF